MKSRSSKQSAIKKAGTRHRLTALAALIGALMGALVLSLASCRGGAPGDSSANPSSAALTAGREGYDLILPTASGTDGYSSNVRLARVST